MIANKYNTFLLLLLAVIATSYFILPYTDYGMKVMGVFGIALLLFSIYSWNKVSGAIISPYIIFLISAYIFTFGQSFLFIFDKVSPERDLMNMFSVFEILPAQFLTLMFLGCFHFGALLSCKKKIAPRLNANYTYNDEVNLSNQIYGIRKVGMLFIVISIIPYLFERFTIFYIASTMGYGGLYDQEVKIGIFNIVNILSQYFMPGLLCLLLVEKSKKKRNIYIVVLFLEIVFWMYVGGRSAGVIVASILLMYYHICVKRIYWKQFIILAVAGYFFISILGVIAETRSDANSKISKTASENMEQGGAFYSAISEMGGSMYPMITTMKLVPSQYDYKYGSSYLFSLTSIVPNIGFWDLHPAMKYGNLNDWLQKAMYLNYGPGYSIVAEPYINFGYFGFLIMLLLGYCFGRIFTIDIRDQKNPLLLVLSFIFCFFVIKTVRNSFLSTIRSVFYFIIPIYYIVRYYYKGKIIK